MTVRYVEPHSNGNGNGGAAKVKAAPPRPKRSRVRKQDVITAAAHFAGGFTLAELAADVGCSAGAAKQHVVTLTADGVLAKTSEVRARGAAVWKLRDSNSEPGAEDGAEPPSDANPESAPAAAEDTLFPAVPVGPGDHETQNPPPGPPACSEGIREPENVIEPEPAADPFALALTEFARRRQVLEAAEQALAAVARL